ALLVCGAIAGRAAMALVGSPATPRRALVATALGAAAGLVVQAVFAPGLIAMSLAAARGEPVRLAALGAGAKRAAPMLATILVTTLLTLLSGALLVVPAAVVVSGLTFAQFFVVDQGLGPLAGVRASLRATDGHKFKV